MRNRRNVGVAGIKKKQAAAAANADVATTMKASTAAHASQAITALTTAIEAFAQTHKEEIKTDPAFRSQFLKMCTPLGIDPLSSENGFWGKALGIGDFYYELAIKASEVCVASKNRNGGVIALSELRGILERRENAKFNIKNNNNLLQKKKKKTVKISEADVETAIKKMEILGTSFKIVDINAIKMVFSVPLELDSDHIVVLKLAESTDRGDVMIGAVTVKGILENTKWGTERVERALELLLKEGMVWIDEYNSERAYYFPSLCL